MPSRSDGFALLSLAIIILGLCLFLSLSITKRSMFAASIQIGLNHFQGLESALDSQMMHFLADLLASKDLSNTISQTSSVGKITITAESEVPEQLGTYQYKVRVTGQAKLPKSKLVSTQQSVTLGAFLLVDKVVDDKFTRIDNHQLAATVFTPLINQYALPNFFAKYATRKTKSCQRLSTKDTGVIVVMGDCMLANERVGTPNRPVAMIVINGDLDLQGSTKITGLVMQICTHKPSHSIELTGSNPIRGALVSTCTGSDLASINTSNITYDTNVLTTFLAHPDNLILEVITGSWSYE